MPSFLTSLRPPSRFVRLLPVLAGLFLASSAEARLAIAPATITVRLDKGRPSGTFQLTNLGDKTERYRARAVHFALSEGGALLFPPPDDLSLAPWIRFNPAEFEIPPNATRVIRYTILPPKGLAKGEYWGGIEFEPLKGTLSSYSDGEGRTFNITVLMDALVTIFGQMGEPSYQLKLTQAWLKSSNNSNLLNVQLQNCGLGKLNLSGGEFKLLDQRGTVVLEGPLSDFPLLRGAKRTITAELADAVAPGGYIVKITFAARQLDAPFSAEVPVTVDQ